MSIRMRVIGAIGVAAVLSACGPLIGRDAEKTPAAAAPAVPEQVPLIPEVAAVAIEPCAVPSCHALSDMSLYEFSNAGRKEGAAMVTDGQEGFLLYGPYMAFEPGAYRLVLNGTVEESAGAKLDIVGGTGSVTFADITLPQQSGNLIDTIVTIPEAVGDLEVRVFVTGASKARIDGVTLRPVG